MKKVNSIILGGVVLGVVSLLSASFVPSMKVHAKTSQWKYGIGSALGFNENTYETIEKGTKNDAWRDGSVTANGEICFI